MGERERGQGEEDWERGERRGGELQLTYKRLNLVQSKIAQNCLKPGGTKGFSLMQANFDLGLNRVTKSFDPWLVWFGTS